LAKCAAILTALSLSATPIEATRSDGMGIGCHSYGAKNYWLASPSYKPSATVASARIVCGCLE
jgi:hypothetical protein